jgi:hypothetical protein
MRPLSKTDLRRSRPALRPPQPAPRNATGPDEEALLFGETQRAIDPPPSPEREREERIAQ